MLILARHPGQQIRIGDDIIIRVLAVNGKQVTIGIEAPRSVNVDREEIYARKKASVAQMALHHRLPEDEEALQFIA